MSVPTILVHGGAGRILRHTLDDEREAACRAGLTRALEAGREVLRRGGSALDAVQAAVGVLEDDPEFNAGRGGVLNADGEIELDASLMEGTTRRAGAVCGLRRWPNPIRVARALLEDGTHVAQAGEGAERFAASLGLPDCSPHDLLVPARRAQWERLRGAGTELDHGGAGPNVVGAGPNVVGPDHDAHGTVGAVAMDASGRLAAATSTGGMVNKRPGRVSDSAQIGAGTWAQDGLCAVSCTGHGEAYLRACTARRIAAQMEWGGVDLVRAASEALDEVERLGGTGGLIALDGHGRPVALFRTDGMFTGRVQGDGPARTSIWESLPSGSDPRSP